MDDHLISRLIRLDALCRWNEEIKHWLLWKCELNHVSCLVWWWFEFFFRFIPSCIKKYLCIKMKWIFNKHFDTLWLLYDINRSTGICLPEHPLIEALCQLCASVSIWFASPFIFMLSSDYSALCKILWCSLILLSRNERSLLVSLIVHSWQLSGELNGQCVREKKLCIDD